jgi:hypothetical protein
MANNRNFENLLVYLRGTRKKNRRVFEHLTNFEPTNAGKYIPTNNPNLMGQ